MTDVPFILVVDDDPTTRALLQGLLQKEGYRVLTAQEGPEGRELAARHAPDIILLDVNMPGESGFETCTQLKADPFASAIPVLFLSAQDDLDSKLKGLELGAVDYITKPFQRAEVLARVRTHLRLAQMYQEWMEYQRAKLAQLSVAQRAILPSPEDVPGAGFAVRYQPLHEAGGDFYDIIPAGEGITDYVVADVSGHDLGTTLATAALKVLLRQRAGPLYSPVETLQMTNQAIRSVLSGTQYITLVYARLNRRARTLLVASAGHPPLVLARQKAEPVLLDVVGDVLGSFEHAVFDTMELKLEKGDRFYLYSDGVTDCPWLQAVPGDIQDRTLAAFRSDPPPPTVDEALSLFEARLLQAGPSRDDVCILGVEV